MLKKLRTDLDEILELVKKCPPDLQSVALKTLLEHWLSLNAPIRPPTPELVPAGPTPPSPVPPVHGGEIPQLFRTQMIASGLTQAEVGRVFHPVGPGAQLVASEIPGTRNARQQVNLALLLSARQALEGGQFGCGLEDLRQMCLHYDCYDSSNFAATLKNNSDLFKTRKKGEDIELSAAGMRKAADLIKQVAAAAHA
jgi:hypothetical protein